ncbi:MAG: hypothetical protein WBO95_06485, partial [Candidatus Dechloromonas phosphoritropha]
MVWTSLARTERNHERGEQRISVHNRVVHHQRQAIDKDFLLLLLGLTDGEVDYDPAEPAISNLVTVAIRTHPASRS